MKKTLYIILCVCFSISFFGGLGNWHAFGADPIRVFATIISLILAIVFGYAAGNTKKKVNQNILSNANSIESNSEKMETNNEKLTNKYSTVTETEYTPNEIVKITELVNNAPGILIHKDYWNKYILELKAGKLSLTGYYRNGTKMEVRDDFWNIASFGKCNTINQITLSGELRGKTENQCFGTRSLIPNPYSGYLLRFMTENDMQFMRLYVSDFKLNNEDDLISIAVHYDLIK